MQVKEIARSTQKSVKPEVAKEMMDKLRKEHSKMIKGKYEFIDAQGGFLEFNYRFFPDDVLVTYKFIHNETCEIPMGLVKHLNNSVKKIRNFGLNTGADRGNELPDRGLPSTYTTSSRVRFTPLDVL